MGGVTTDATSLEGKQFRYKYPNGLSLHPGSDLHNKIRDRIINRAFVSHNAMEQRHHDWRANDEMLNVYIRADAEERIVQSVDERKPIAIVVPALFAVLDTLLTYMSAAFIQNPVFRFRGSGPEDTVGALILEKSIQQQIVRSKVELSLYALWRDAFTYGVGLAAPIWYAKHGKKTISQQGFHFGSAIAALSGAEPTPFTEKIQVDALLYEGNRLDNIDPFMTFFDVNFPFYRLQDSEYIGWLQPSSRMTILGEELDDDKWFNARYLEFIDGRSSFMEEFREPASNSFVKRQIDSDTNPVDIINMYITIVPNEWELGPSKRPEKWFFALAGDSVVIQATPLGLDHGMYPVVVCVPDFDGHTIAPLSRLELAYPMQHALNWFINSRVANVRKSLNDMFIVNPSMVNMADLENPGPGKLIKMRISAWNKNPKDAITQFPVADVTQSHVADAAMLLDLINRITGAVDNAQGVPRQHGERISAKEAGDLNAGALGKFRKLAQIIGAMTHRDIAFQMASNTQQFAELETYMELTTGTWMETLTQTYGGNVQVDPIGQRFLKVSPEELDINYDVVIHDGSLPASGDVASLLNMFQFASGDPELRQAFDLVRMYERVAQMAGFNNIHEFLRKGGSIQTQVEQPAEIQNQVQRGNLLSLTGGQ